ncbi:flagellar basal body L-ring protein FlgH [Pelagibaculum spongiae]|uniref:Flagellar L-ring protein n=1 Tax=Pelagibaculum spongiae TaxID=2080658 RepID=A0A2V1GTZ5_9GAMM|nr:flagellar basal body L-ring protein FlgH [Pelagibaculum spongiae]PVZ66741.1 flagellar basal body L-ring protein FlgH [Pelagibaculum spongiae]
MRLNKELSLRLLFKAFSLLLSIAFTMLLSGCLSQPPRPDQQPWAPIVVPVEKTKVINNGAIFQIQSPGMDLFSDRRAHQVGDILTVTLDEQTNAQKSSNSNLSKTNEVTLGAPTLLGAPITINGNNLSAGLEGERSFSGNTDAKQSNSLKGSISVVVAAVHGNGLLEVRGEKWMTINQGEEFIRLSGLVRAEDVAPDNTVPSNRIANARISYSATGEQADVNTNGWLARFFNSKYWPL